MKKKKRSEATFGQCRIVLFNFCTLYVKIVTDGDGEISLNFVPSNQLVVTN